MNRKERYEINSKLEVLSDRHERIIRVLLGYVETWDDEEFVCPISIKDIQELSRDLYAIKTGKLDLLLAEYGEHPSDFI